MTLCIVSDSFAQLGPISIIRYEFNGHIYLGPQQDMQIVHIYIQAGVLMKLSRFEKAARTIPHIFCKLTVPNRPFSLLLINPIFIILNHQPKKFVTVNVCHRCYLKTFILSLAPSHSRSLVRSLRFKWPRKNLRVFVNIHICIYNTSSTKIVSKSQY